MSTTLISKARLQLQELKIVQIKEEKIKELIEKFSLNGDFSKILMNLTTEVEKNIELLTHQKLMEFEAWYEYSHQYDKLYNKKGLYLGSGKDIEYPIILGLKDIFMVDKLFLEPEGIKEFEDRIKRLYKASIKKSEENKYALELDNGNKIILNLIPAYAKSFNLDKKVGMIINSDGICKLENIGNLLQNLSVNGYYIGFDNLDGNFKERLNINNNRFYEKVK